jgi:hypothetical protein
MRGTNVKGQIEKFLWNFRDSLLSFILIRIYLRKKQYSKTFIFIFILGKGRGQFTVLFTQSTSTYNCREKVKQFCQNKFVVPSLPNFHLLWKKIKSIVKIYFCVSFESFISSFLHKKRKRDKTSCLWCLFCYFLIQVHGETKCNDDEQSHPKFLSSALNRHTLHGQRRREIEERKKNNKKYIFFVKKVFKNSDNERCDSQVMYKGSHAIGIYNKLRLLSLSPYDDLQRE